MATQINAGATAEDLAARMKLVADAGETYIAAIFALDDADTLMDGTTAAAATTAFYDVLAAAVGGEAVNPYV